MRVFQTRHWACLLLAAMFLRTKPLFAQVVGAASTQFMSRGPGAEAAAMAGTVVSDIHDPTALYWNPAGLVDAGGMISGEHLFLVGGARYDFIGLSVPSNLGTFGLGMIQLGRDNIIARSAIDDPGYNVSNTQSDYMAGFAHSFGQHWSAGLAANILDFNLAGYSNTGWGLDSGLQGHYEQDDFMGVKQVIWLMGADIKNMVEPQINLAGDPESYPRGLRIGGGMSFQAASRLENSGVIEHDRVTILFSFERSNGDPNIYPALGFSYSYLNILIFRAGFDGTLSAGMGFHTEDDRFSLDYSFENDPLGLNHRFTLSYRFSNPEHSPHGMYREMIDNDYLEVKTRAESLANENFTLGETLFNNQEFPKAETVLRLAAFLNPDNKKINEAYVRVKKAAKVQKIHDRETEAVLNPAPGQEGEAYVQIASLLNLGADHRNRLIQELHEITLRIPADRYAQLSAQVFSEGVSSAQRLVSIGRLSAAENIVATLQVLSSSNTLDSLLTLKREVQADDLAVRENFAAIDREEADHPDIALVKAALALSRAFPDDPSLVERAKVALKSFREQHDLSIRERFYLRKLYYLAAIDDALRAPEDIEESVKFLDDILIEDPANRNANALLDDMSREGLAKL